jgi:hypothetical protein
MTTTIEDYFFNASFLGALTNFFAYALCCVDVASALEALLNRRGCAQSYAGNVVDELR